MRREVPVNIGRDTSKFADIVVYRSIEAANSYDQGQIRFCVEVKADSETDGHNQLVSYVFMTSAEGAVWTNYNTTRYYRRFDIPEHRLEPWNGIPGPEEMWDALGLLSKDLLVKPKDVKGLLRKCHQKLFRSGIESEDLAMDMVRIILAKWRDEISEQAKARFYCTPEEYLSPSGRSVVARRVQELFAEVRNQNLDIFERTEQITAPDDHIAEVVSELQRYRLLVDEEQWWDILGAAYEQYTAAHFRQANGQFFTNRLVIHMMVEIVNPTVDDVVLDPAGGSGGFITATIRHIRKHLTQQGLTSTARQQLFDQVRRSVGLVEKASRLVRVAKTAAILTGDGHDNFHYGDSLRPLTDKWFPPSFIGRFGAERPTVILTNPPYAGTTDGKITDKDILNQFDVAKIWKKNGELVPTNVLIAGGTPPELLFLERCIKWLRPGGRIGVVIARGMLDTATALSARTLLFSHTRLKAVIALHKDTFQPHTGVRTCVLILEKPEGTGMLGVDYPIFMAISRKIGQDSEGVPIFKHDELGHETGELDHDLDDIFMSYQDFQHRAITDSEYIFSIQRSSLDQDTLNINPQHYLPAYNDSIRRVLEIGEKEGWSVKTIGNLEPTVFKGARFRRQNLETSCKEGLHIEPFFTPAALLQDRADSVKYLDLSQASTRQREQIEASRAKHGELLITRSGSIGRVLFVTKQLANSIISDDLIHIRLDDKDLCLYLYIMLKSEIGQHQMLRNEYGTVQTHLEPHHVRDIIVPIPDDRKIIESVAKYVGKSIKGKEQSWRMEERACEAWAKVVLNESFK